MVGEIVNAILTRFPPAEVGLTFFVELKLTLQALTVGRINVAI